MNCPAQADDEQRALSLHPSDPGTRHLEPDASLSPIQAKEMIRPESFSFDIPNIFSDTEVDPSSRGMASADTGNLRKTQQPFKPSARP